MDNGQVRRRRVLQLAGAVTAGTLAGCAGVLSSGQLPQCGTESPADLDAPSIGDPTARITVAEYSDFSCPHCREYALDVLPEIRRTYIQSGDIWYEHHAFPLPVDKWSRPAASAAREVQRRVGDRAFFEYASALYRNQDAYSYGLFNELASTINVSGEPIENAARNGAYCAVLNESIKQGRDRGVSATPTVFVNDQKLPAPNAEKLSTAIEKAAKTSGRNP